MGGTMILLSGGFDPLHGGHINMIHDAREYGQVHIALNSDDWLIRKKGFYFQTWDERAYILEAVVGVNTVIEFDDDDDTACEALREFRPQYFGNGGDRTAHNTPELQLCKELGIIPVFELGGEKAASSSAIGARACVERLWGHYVVLDEGPGYKVKRLVVNPGGRTSLQKHAKRDEVWVFSDGSVLVQPRGEYHRLVNKGDEPMTVIEVQTGICEEDDIERI